MPVSSFSSRVAVCASDSASSWLPVTDCQKPGKSARSSNSTRNAGVCTSTSVDTGILWLKEGLPEALAEPAVTFRRTGHARLMNEYPEWFMPFAPVFGRLAQNVAQRFPRGGVGLAVACRMTDRDNHAMTAEPVAILETVGKRVPVAAEMVRQLEAFGQCRQKRALAVGARGIDRMKRKFGRTGRRFDRIKIAMPVTHAGFVANSKVGQLHGRMLLND